MAGCHLKPDLRPAQRHFAEGPEPEEWHSILGLNSSREADLNAGGKPPFISRTKLDFMLPDHSLAIRNIAASLVQASRRPKLPDFVKNGMVFAPVRIAPNAIPSCNSPRT